MDVNIFIKQLQKSDIDTIIGVPDSALKGFCNYINNDGKSEFNHFVPANEGAAVGVAIGHYLATGKAACVYMQNSGLGNAINPITSLANEKIYGIPMLFLIGWRGIKGKKDEPQHRFMGMITDSLLDNLSIEYGVLTRDTGQKEFEEFFVKAKKNFSMGRQFAIIAEPGVFDKNADYGYQNCQTLIREEVIKEIISNISEDDIIVSTTGKISREVYEQSECLKGHHRQAFLTVGGMGHASMIAFGIAKERPDRRVYCFDGDGAVLMHMGNLAFLGKQNLSNMVHICLNNDAHESVGGMPTGCVGLKYADIAKDCGYAFVEEVHGIERLREVLNYIKYEKKLTFLEIKIAIYARADLGRPKESAGRNRISFMEYIMEG